jgi:predicted ATPase
VHQLVQPGLREQFPALRSLASTPNNLSQQLNSFIGRERELVDLQALLAKQRLVTLIGLGGIGKTRLSMQLAAQVLDDYPDGVWFVELAPLADPQLVPQAVASVLGVKEDAGRPIIEALTRFVQDRRLLITFDNCEHVVQACADLANQLLRASPNVKLLASSREALQIAGEVTYPVPPLGVPDHRHVPTVADVAAQESVRLFVDRVRVAQPAFVVDEENALAVGQICRQLDGIPLALELAAARARQMSVTTLASRIGDRFKLLTNGDRSALPRQQTLRALIDWSHDLLSEPERALFRRLSVFAGGWTLEAAEAVCADELLPKDDILDNLGRLVEKSLVSIDLACERYRMLETVRQYAKEGLFSANESITLGGAHLNYFLNVAETARPELGGLEQGYWFGLLEADRENLLGAHATCDFIDGGADRGVRLIHALRPYFINGGLLGLGLRVAAEALARVPGSSRNIFLYNAMFSVGQFGFFSGQYDLAIRRLKEALELARELGNPELEIVSLQVLGNAYLGRAQKGLAKECLEYSYELSSRLGFQRWTAFGANALAQYCRAEGDQVSAFRFNMETLLLAKQCGEGQLVSVSLLNLAMLHVDKSEFDSARKCLLETVQLDSAKKSTVIVQSLLEVCAGMASSLHDWEASATMYAAAEEVAKASGLKRDRADEEYLLPRVEDARVALGNSRFRDIASLVDGWDAGTAMKFVEKWLVVPSRSASHISVRQ